MEADDNAFPRSEVPLPEDCEAESLTDDLVLLSFPLPVPTVPQVLTEAEEDIVVRVFRGQSNAVIARERGKSPRTVVNQLDAVYRKLGVNSRFELVALLRGRWEE